MDVSIQEKIDDRDAPVTFLLPTPRMRMRLRRKATAHYKEKYADSLYLSRMEEDEIVARLLRFDEDGIAPGKFIDYIILTEEGVDEAMREALAEYGEEIESLIDGISGSRQQEILAKLWGVTLTPKVESPAPNPPRPLTFATDTLPAGA